MFSQIPHVYEEQEVANGVQGMVKKEEDTLGITILKRPLEKEECEITHWANLLLIQLPSRLTRLISPTILFMREMMQFEIQSR